MATGFPIQRGCCLALSVPHPTPCPVPLCHIPSPAHSLRPVVSLSPWAVVRPHPIPHPVFISHRAASNPVARAYWILINPGTVYAPSTARPLLAPASFPCAASRHPPRPVPHVPLPSQSPGAFVWLLPPALLCPVPFSQHPVFLVHRAASNPLAGAHWILKHQGTVSCA